MNVAAIIPARGGSKGLPGKNLLPIGRPAVPLLVRAIWQCNTCPEVNSVWVTSDCERIRKVAATAGAQTIKRPAEISGDHTPTEAALLHACDTLPWEVDTIALVQCTAPLLCSETISRCVKALADSTCTTAVATMPFDGLLVKPLGDGLVRGVGWRIGTFPGQRRQDRSGYEVITGECYVMDRGAFVNRESIWGARLETVHSCSPIRLEIDTPEDFLVAEALLNDCKSLDRTEGTGEPVCEERTERGPDCRPA